MTRQELRRNQIVGRALAGLLVLVPLTILGWGWFWRDRFLTPDRSLNPLGIVLLISLLFHFVGSLSVISRVHRRYRVTCPQCRKTLAGPARAILLSTGRCCDCGHQILT